MDAQFYSLPIRGKTVSERSISAKMRYVFRRVQNRDIGGGYMGSKRVLLYFRQKYIILLDVLHECAEINGTILNLM